MDIKTVQYIARWFGIPLSQCQAVETILSYSIVNESFYTVERNVINGAKISGSVKALDEIAALEILKRK